MEKREDHPLWSEYRKWLLPNGVDGETEVCSCTTCDRKQWPAFLAGVEAVKKALAVEPSPAVVRLINAVERLEVLGHRQESQIGEQVGDQARLLKILLRLEELGKQPTPMELSHVANRLNGAIAQLKALTKRYEKMGLMVTVTENADVTMGGLHKG